MVTTLPTNNLAHNPIGIFDSGIGGITILTEIYKLLPKERLIYYGDLEFCPYGERSEEEIKKRSIEISDFFLANACKAVVVACNTATSAAIPALREKYAIPFIGIEPAIKPATLLSQTNSIGVLATKNTLNGHKFKDSVDKYAKGTKLNIQIGDGLVELVEAGKLESPEAEQLVRKYINPMLADQVDQIVLGCTHYPFLIPLINRITTKANVINPAPAVAKRLKSILVENYLLNSSSSVEPVQLFLNGKFNSSFLEKMLNDKNIKFDLPLSPNP